MDSKYHSMMEKAFLTGGLLDALLEAEAADGYVTEDAIRAAADIFAMPAAAVYDTVSFYGMLHSAPKCTHEIRVCRGASCHVDDAESIRLALERYLGITMGEATPGRSCDLDYMACQGRCGDGPVISIDGELYTRQTAESVVELLKKGGIQ